MRFQRLAALVASLSLLPLVSVGTGDEPKKPDDKQVVDSKAEKRSSAAGIDFRKELNLPYGSLGTLGSRIESARKAKDPVALAHAASELATAEQVSGKKASMTSQALLKDASELARMRHEVTELKAVLNVQQQIANEADEVKYLKDAIKNAQDETKAETAAIRKGEEPTGERKVLINNYTAQYAGVSVNGYFKTIVPAGESKWIVIEHKWNPTVLTAEGNDDLSAWPKRIIWGNFKTYTWNLY